MQRISVKRRIAAVAISAAGLVFFAACESDEIVSDTGGRPPAAIRVNYYSGANQSERVGAEIGDPVVVRVTDRLGAPVSCECVTFSTEEPGASVSPATAYSDEKGLARCRFRLGDRLGLQFMKASVSGHETAIGATAVAIECLEEWPERNSPWAAGHLFIATGASGQSRPGNSMILDYDPASGALETVLETAEAIDGMSFSPRGELFVSIPGRVMKVDYETRGFMPYVDLPANEQRISLEPNEGGVLSALGSGTPPLVIGCAAQGYRWAAGAWGTCCAYRETFAADPATRDLFAIISFDPPEYLVARMPWDGRTACGYGIAASVYARSAAPRGMCVDGRGTLYAVFEGIGTYRRIVSISSEGRVNEGFFNLYAQTPSDREEARWGDIACIEETLYIIDTHGNRLVEISTSGEWLRETRNTAFSREFDDGESYSLAVSPR